MTKGLLSAIKSGTAEAPRKASVKGQPHFLAYITEDEAAVLRERGGGIDENGQQIIGPDEVPAFPPGADPGHGPGAGSGGGSVGGGGGGRGGGRDGGGGGHPGMGGTSNRNGPSTSIGAGVNNTSQMGGKLGGATGGRGHPGMTNNPVHGFNAIDRLKSHSTTGINGLTGGAKRTKEMQAANAYNDFDNPMNSNNPVDRSLAAVGGMMGLTADPRKSDPNAIAGILAGGVPMVGLAMKGYRAIDGIRRGDFRNAGALAGGMVAGMPGAMAGKALGGMLGTGTPAEKGRTARGMAKNAVSAFSGGDPFRDGDGGGGGAPATGGSPAPNPSPAGYGQGGNTPAAPENYGLRGLLTQEDVDNRPGYFNPDERFSADWLMSGTF
jgi:hypothetical protein